MRPWTAVWRDKETGRRKSSVFQGSYDMGRAAEEFKSRYVDRNLEIMIPGVHEYMYIEQRSTTVDRGSNLFRHDHGV